MDLKNFKNMDVNILMSIVNMKIRDEFGDLEELISYYGIDKEELKEKLKSGGFEYNKEAKHFV